MNKGQYPASTPHPNGPSWAESLFKNGSRAALLPSRPVRGTNTPDFLWLGASDPDLRGAGRWDDPTCDPRAAIAQARTDLQQTPMPGARHAAPTPAESALRGAAWTGHGPEAFIDAAREQVRTGYPSGLKPTPADTAYADGEAELYGVMGAAFGLKASDLAGQSGESYHRAHAAREALNTRPMRFEYVTGPLPAPQPQREPRAALPPELRALLRERYPRALPKGAATALLTLHLRAKLAGLTIHEDYFRRDNHTANTMHEDWDAPIKRHPRY